MSGPVPIRAEFCLPKCLRRVTGIMTQPSEPVPASVRAQILATEHWGLLAVRSQTWNEVMGRISAQLTFTSAVLVFLALAVQGLGYTATFRSLAIALGWSCC